MRWSEHLRDAIKGNCNSPLLENAIRKYGPDNWAVDIVEYCDIAELERLEEYYIEHFETLTPNGYNLTTGGKHGRISEESRHKMSIARMGHIVSEETRNLQRESNIGQTRSEEARKKMSEAAQNRVVSMETKRKMGDTNRRVLGEKQGRRVEINGKPYISVREAARQLKINPQTLYTRLRQPSDTCRIINQERYELLLTYQSQLPLNVQIIND